MNNHGAYRIEKSDLDNRLHKYNGFEFECIIANLFNAKGYYIRKGYNGIDHNWGLYNESQVRDDGVDILIEDAGDNYVVQCKHYETNKIGSPEIRDLIGACIIENIEHGKFVTTSSFTDGAINTMEKAANAGIDIELWNWNRLKKELVEHLLAD